MVGTVVAEVKDELRLSLSWWPAGLGDECVCARQSPGMESLGFG
jgi:hypothetical protein